MNGRNTFFVLAEILVEIFDRLRMALASPDDFYIFILEFGWDMKEIPQPILTLASPINAITNLLESGDMNLVDLIKSIRSLFSSINQIKDMPDELFPESIDPTQFKNDFPIQLIDHLIADYLLNRNPLLGKLCHIFGIIKVNKVDAAGKRLGYIEKVIAWQDVSKLLGDPFTLIKNNYDWNSGNFNAEELLNDIVDLTNSLDIHSSISELEPDLAKTLLQGAPTQPIHHSSIVWPIFESEFEDLDFNLGIALSILPKTATKDPGLAILPYGPSEISTEFELTDTLTLKIEGGMDLSDGIAILIRPKQKVEVLVNVISTGEKNTSSGSFAIVIENRQISDSKTLLIGTEKASRFEVGIISLKGGTRVNSASKNDVYVEFELKDALIVIKPNPEDSDSFLNSLLPRDGFSVDFSMLLGFCASQGFYFGGSGGLEVSLPAHLAVGPIEIQGVTLAIKASGGIIPMDIGTTIKGCMGPLEVIVEDMGLRAKFSFPGNSTGNLCPIDLNMGFKPPKGVGISIDSGVIKGGGYLYLDYDKGEYAGALELVVSGWINLKAIGLINTRLPGGQPGFSLLVIITADFGETGFQLGYGFTLLAVGGLLGLNRIAKLEPLVEGIRTGAINDIMFPKDVLANAPRIISDLRAIFPPQANKFLIGPMAKIGWGTPTLISVSLGVIIEFPGPNIAILGVLKVALPAEQTPLLVLQVNFIGAIESDKKRLWFFASLFESRVLWITIEGDMGLLVAWGDDADFVLSVGGFHPQFTPPPLPFPTPKRITVSILNIDYARIQSIGYFAVTSNTVQYGSRSELYFGFNACNISGHMAFDALIQFSPFYFIVQVSCELSLKVFGMGLFSIRLRFSLEGPTPWRAIGSGSISFFFFSIDVNFDITWGESHDTTLPDIEVMPLLKKELEKLTNWTAKPPCSSNLLVVFRKLEETPGEVVLHPAGTLRISQKAVPLDITFDKVGNQKVSDFHKLTPTVTGDLVKVDDVYESFAMAQFQEMDNAAKLTLPPYELQHGGLELSIKDMQIASSLMVKRIVRYETVIIDSNYRRLVLHFFKYWNGLFAHFLNGNAVTLSELSKASKNNYQPFDEKIEVKSYQYAVAFGDNNRPHSPGAEAFESEALAYEYLRGQVRIDPNLAEKLHVIPHVEVNSSA